MTMISMNYLSRYMMRHVRVKIILPHEELHPERGAAAPWKTLYFLHGYTENADQLVSTIHLMEMSSKYGIAIVIPDGENSFYVNHSARNSSYENMMAEELVKVTRMLFPLSDRYEDTWIGGFSMGGFGALMLGLRHSDVFSKIAALAPACMPYGRIGGHYFPDDMLTDIFGGRENYFAEYDPFSLMMQHQTQGKQMPELFMRCGIDDVMVYEICSELREKMKNAGIVLDYKEYPGGHTAEFANYILPETAEFLLKKG